MQLGYELIKEQRFFRRELSERVGWFIGLRWCFLGAGLAGCLVLRGLQPGGPFWPMMAVFFFIGISNILFERIYRNLRAGQTREAAVFNRFAHWQISLDLAALMVLIHLTGGLFSPLIYFAVFHILISGFLLSPVSCFIYAGLISAAIGAITLLHPLGLPPKVPFFLGPVDSPRPDPMMLFCFYLIYAGAMMVAAWLTTAIKIGLRYKGRQLLQVSKALENSNSKLTALSAMLGAMGRCTDLQELMDSATQSTTAIMGVKGCSIKLLDESRHRLQFASTYGLSGHYLSGGAIDIDSSPVNRSVLDGARHTVGNIQDSDAFQYPEEIRREGIASMICLPLRVERAIFGVFCIYSGQPDFFTEEDTRFFERMAGLTALAIENLKRELNKTWFLQKSAHQLRSPLNTVLSMLKTLRLAYLGPLSAPQLETLLRCERRVDGLQKMVNDLLGLGLRRSGGGGQRLEPVSVAALLKGLIAQFQVLAAERRVTFQLETADPLPRVLADASMFDELFMNLISNAVKYTADGGNIRIHLDTVDSATLRFRIQDTGIGIPTDHMPRLFTEFSRAPNAKAHTEEGTGLGLVIVKEIIERLNGTIRVESREGEGTCVTLLIPAA